ncbi:hypothetical protein BDV98DRAFT_560270 [Pterulicium gracile]|uniref:Uncharacterized protein n=1 Tax=Pterulicium gracile TaxID=1884261 RepID=A0A5C3QUA7_9AGAR|nr:hypothetical protein BDV98DRAFT_560270 [Pterula gracilis]
MPAELPTQPPPEHPIQKHRPPSPLPPKDRKSGFLGLTILAAVILPITLTPYLLLLRRRLRTLNQSLEELRAINATLVQDVVQWRLETSANTDALARMRSMMGKRMEEMAAMKMLADQRDNAVGRALHGVRGDLRKLGDSSRSQTATLGALGTSLADVAAFIYEVNIRHGSSNEQSDRKVEDLRSLALMMIHEHRPPPHPERNEVVNAKAERG